MKESTISATEAAHILMLAFGPIRAWGDFLADNIRGKQNISGHTILPACQMHDGRKFRPRYTVASIKQFIADLRKDVAKCEIASVILDVDPSKDWRSNCFDEDGKPIH